MAAHAVEALARGAEYLSYDDFVMALKQYKDEKILFYLLRNIPGQFKMPISRSRQEDNPSKLKHACYLRQISTT